MIINNLYSEIFFKKQWSCFFSIFHFYTGVIKVLKYKYRNTCIYVSAESIVMELEKQVYVRISSHTHPFAILDTW
jgi:hypothetical protein